MRDTSSLTKKSLEVLEQIKTVIDPEVGVNIVDLGLIYNIDFNESERSIHVLMTLSARGCPVGDTILQHVDTVIRSEWAEYDVNVELTWAPEWTPDMITEEGKAALS